MEPDPAAVLPSPSTWGSADLPSALRSWWDGVPSDLRITEEERREFEVDFARDFAREVEVFVPVVTVVNVLCWLADPWIFARIPGAVEAYAVGRGLLVALALLVVIVLQARPLWSPVVAMVGGSAGAMICAITVSSLGPWGTPWFSCLFSVALGPIFWYQRPPTRIVVTLVVTAAVLGGYVGGNPAYLDDPSAPAMLLYLAFIVVVCLGVGLRADRWRLRHYCAQRDLAAERRTLAGRVEAQTAELRAFARRLDQVRDAEQARVARELHDELGQTLTAARLSLKLAVQRFDRDPSTILPNLRQSATLLDQLTVQTRTLVHALRPPVLDDLGLVAAVEWLAARSERAGGPPCAVEAPAEPPPFPAEVAMTAFRCVQEALTNVARHATARAVWVRLVVVGDRLEVEVRDDGVGAPAERGTGLGLVGMRERAAALGGELRFESWPGAGCRVWLSLPLSPPAVA